MLPFGLAAAMLVAVTVAIPEVIVTDGSPGANGAPIAGVPRTGVEAVDVPAELVAVTVTT